MKKRFLWIGIFLVGLLVGAGSLRWIEVSTRDAALEQQKSELAKLTLTLKEKEAELAAGQARLDGQAARIREELTRAVSLSDQILSGQGSTVDRLKNVISLIRQIQLELKGLN